MFFMSADPLMALRKSQSLQFRTEDVEVVPARPGVNVYRETSLSVVYWRLIP